jgi:nitroreductase
MTAPVSLLLVADVSKFGDSKENRWQTIGAIDVGIVTENICLFCAAANLAVVPRASMDTASLKRVLKLNDSKLLLMNTPVGYFKK